MKPRKGKWLDRLYPLPFYLRLCLSEAEFIAELERLKVKERPQFTKSDAGATTHTFDHPTARSIYIVTFNVERVLKCKAGWVEVAGLLIHEAVHVFQGYCLDIGERAPSAEFEAYTIQWISQQLLEAWSAQRPR